MKLIIEIDVPTDVVWRAACLRLESQLQDVSGHIGEGQVSGQVTWLGKPVGEWVIAPNRKAG